MGRREGGEIGRITKTGRDGEFFRGNSVHGSPGKGDRTISNAEVSIPFPREGRRLFLVTVALSPPTPWPAAPRVVGPYEKRRPWGTCDKAGAPFIRSVDVFNQN